MQELTFDEIEQVDGGRKCHQRHRLVDELELSARWIFDLQIVRDNHMYPLLHPLRPISHIVL